MNFPPCELHNLTDCPFCRSLDQAALTTLFLDEKIDYETYKKQWFAMWRVPEKS